MNKYAIKVMDALFYHTFILSDSIGLVKPAEKNIVVEKDKMMMMKRYFFRKTAM
jgi:hypothetical protein